MTRREFIKTTAVAGAGVAVLSKFAIPSARAVAFTQNNLAKWVQPLRNLTALGDPNGIPCLTPKPDPVFPNTDFYEITAGEFTDQLHPALGGPTTLWGYFDSNNPVKRHLGGVIIATRGRAVRLRVTNALPPNPIIPLDTSSFFLDAATLRNKIAIHLHGGYIPAICDGGPWDWWAPNGKTGPSFLNGPGGVLDNITTANGALNPQPLRPGQADYYYPNQQSMRLMWYHDHAHDQTRTNAYSGLATAYLLLDGINQAYVDQGKIPGLTSTIPLVWQDKVFVGPTTLSTDPTWPLAIAPRHDLLQSGSLWYEHIYSQGDLNPTPTSPLLPLPTPSCVPEFFGDTMLCNGTVHPLLTVEAKRYRFLMLNACNSRFLNLNLFQVPRNDPEGITLNPTTLFPTNPVGPDMIQIGNEAGFLHQEVRFRGAKPFNPITISGNLQLGCAERADVIIDFTGQDGKDFVLYSDSAAPNPAGDLDTDFFVGNPFYPGLSKPGYGPDTRQLLRIRVVPATTPDPQPAGPILDPMLTDPANLVDYGPADKAIKAGRPIPPLSPVRGVTVNKYRNLTLNEDFDKWGRLIQMIGTDVPAVQSVSNADPTVPFFGRALDEPATEVADKDSVEVWYVFNTTGDVHPIHIHLTNLQVMWRAPFVYDRVNGFTVGMKNARGPDANELGWKETFRMNPGEVIALITKWSMPTVPFDQRSSPRAGDNGLGALTADPNYRYHEYVYHCHILEHEEHDMMRPLIIREPKQ